MQRVFKYLGIALGAGSGLGVIISAHAFDAINAPTHVQQNAAREDTGAFCQTISNPSVATAQTVTVNVPAGVSYYLTRIYISASGDATGAALNNGRITTGNLQSVEWDYTFPAGTSSFVQIASENNPNGLIKSSQGPLAVTIVAPSSSHVAYGISACGYFAP